MLTEPFTIGVHAAMRGEIKLGDTVVVQGSGAIGLVTLACAKLSVPAKAIMVGGPAGRLELAKTARCRRNGLILKRSPLLKSGRNL